MVLGKGDRLMPCHSGEVMASSVREFVDQRIVRDGMFLCFAVRSQRGFAHSNEESDRHLATSQRHLLVGFIIHYNGFARPR